VAHNIIFVGSGNELFEQSCLLRLHIMQGIESSGFEAAAEAAPAALDLPREIESLGLGFFPFGFLRRGGVCDLLFFVGFREPPTDLAACICFARFETF
jgi:hypothetical protein